MSNKQDEAGEAPVVEDVNQLIQQRQQKAADLRELGENPYRNDYPPEHTAAQVLAALAHKKPEDQNGSDPLIEDRFKIAGRIVEHRSFGKAAFVKVADRTGRFQVYVRKNVVGDEAFAIFKKAEVYDFIGAKGFCFFTRTGELTLMAEEVVLITKAVRPPPEKWSGLKDKETRYRQRYVDLVANPDVAEVFRARSRIIRAIRAYFDERDFLEVETPILHPILGGAAARPFQTHHNALGMDLYMRIAPELYLKRLLVGGFERVYEIGRNFRNEGLDRDHNPEFSMLEFYYAYANYTTLMDLTEDLITGLAQEIRGSTEFQCGEYEVDMTQPWPRVTVAQAVLNACTNLKIEPALTLETLQDEAALEAWCEASGLSKGDGGLAVLLQTADSHGKRMSVLFDQLGEEHLDPCRPTFVIDYPAATSPLSRRKDADPDLVDRFELFVVGRELANAFSELNDPADQRGRFQDQLAQRQGGDEEAMEYDEDYCRALEYGMPPTAGEGIGIDRLVMLLCDQPSIRDVILFPHMRPEGK